MGVAALALPADMAPKAPARDSAPAPASNCRLFVASIKASLCLFVKPPIALTIQSALCDFNQKMRS
jgi:hypothetical protein